MKKSRLKILQVIFIGSIIAFFSISAVLNVRADVSKDTNADIQISNDSRIVMITKEGNPACIYADEWNYLVAQAGTSGFRIANNENNADIIKINGDGTVAEDCLFYQNFINAVSPKADADEQKRIEWIFITVVLIVVVLFVFMLGKIKKLNDTINDLSKTK